MLKLKLLPVSKSLLSFPVVVAPSSLIRYASFFPDTRQERFRSLGMAQPRVGRSRIGFQLSNKNDRRCATCVTVLLIYFTIQGINEKSKASIRRCLPCTQKYPKPSAGSKRNWLNVVAMYL